MNNNLLIFGNIRIVIILRLLILKCIVVNNHTLLNIVFEVNSNSITCFCLLARCGEQKFFATIGEYAMCIKLGSLGDDDKQYSSSKMLILSVIPNFLVFK